MHICHVLPFFYPATQFGGPVTQVKLLSEELARRGHRVSIVTTDMGCVDTVETDQWTEREGYRLWYAGTKSWNRIPPYHCGAVGVPLERTLKSVDVLHLQMGMTMVNSLAAKLSRQVSVPYIYSPRGNLNPRRLRQKRLAKFMFLEIFERSVIEAASAFQALTLREIEELRAQGADENKIRQIPNGVDCSQTSEATTGKATGNLFREKYGIPMHAIVVLFLGQLSWVKGLDLLIPGFSQAARRDSRLHLVIAGPDAGYERHARRTVEKLGMNPRVTFTGHLAPGAKVQAFKSADIFALTSHGEGLPNAILEAASFGLPLIVSEDCNVPEVSTYNAGQLVEKTPTSIANQLAIMSSESCRRQEQGHNASIMAATCFSIDVVVDQLLDLYESIADSRVVQDVCL